MPSKSTHSFELLENVVLGGHRFAADDEKAKEALIDCLLIALEAAEELKMNKTAAFLDLASDFAFAEVQNRPLPKSLLARLVQSVVDEKPKSADPMMSTRRQTKRHNLSRSASSILSRLDKKTA